MLVERIANSLELYLILFAFFTFLAFLARGRDAFKWSKSLKNSGFVNVIFLASGYLFIGLLYYPITGTEALYEWLPMPSIDPAFWEGVPWPVMALIVLLVYDFNLYWIHRFLHLSVFWPTHAVHHSDTQLHFLSWSRAHFTEQFILFAGMLFMGSWLGLSVGSIAMLGFFRALHQHYVHSNLDWDHGLFKNWIVSPTFHRWHHADVPAAYDKNFASIFPFYDIIFGTYYCPGSAKDVPTGFENNPGDNFVKLIAYPFVEWYRMGKEALSKDHRKAPQ